MLVVKQYYGLADKGKEISRLWISDWKKYARKHKKNHLKNEN